MQQLDHHKPSDDEVAFYQEKKDHGMTFNIILNRKGEKVLTVHGFKQGGDQLEGYGSENDENHEDDNTLFINLNKLIENQATQGEVPGIQSEVRASDFLTSNPVTRILENYPYKLGPQQVQAIEIGDEIAAGAHAKVHRASYMLCPVALKIYKNSEA